MNNFDWEDFLKQESRKAIAKCKENQRDDPYGIWNEFIAEYPDVMASEWLGFPGASETQIVAAETRLGVNLSLSYREFLKITNGWCEYPDTVRLRSVEAIEWLYTLENQSWIDGWWILPDQKIPSVPDEEYFVYGTNWYQPLRTEYMQTALQISDDDEGDIILLNPKIIHDGEWEAWLFSCRTPGAKRYRSFQEMLQTIGMVNFWK